MGKPRSHHSNGRLLALPINIILRWKRMALADTLAYYDTATITTVNSLIVDALDSSHLQVN